MEQNKELQLKVLQELDWDPRINAANIGVTVEDGIVTLSGDVSSYFEKVAAEQVVKRVAGVKAVAEELEVKLPAFGQRSDGDLAMSVLDALQWDVSVPDQHVDVKVEHGWVTLQGEVDWDYEKQAAKAAVERLAGVKGITNLIGVRPTVTSAEVKSRIKDFFLKWDIADPDQDVDVKVEGGWVTLQGEVDWYYQKQAAQVAIQPLAGVKGITNLIVVRPTVTAAEIKSKIEDAFKQNALLDAEQITVDVHNGTVVLYGSVRTWAERERAEQVASDAPGVRVVGNNLKVAASPDLP